MILIRTNWKGTVVIALNTFLVFIQTLVNGSKRQQHRSYQAQWKSSLPAKGRRLTNCYVCIIYGYQPTTSEILITWMPNTYIPSFIGKVMSVIWDKKKSKFLFSPWHLSYSVHQQLLKKISCHTGEKTLSSELLARKLQSRVTTLSFA